MQGRSPAGLFFALAFFAVVGLLMEIVYRAWPERVPPRGSPMYGRYIGARVAGRVCLAGLVIGVPLWLLLR